MKDEHYNAPKSENLNDYSSIVVNASAAVHQLIKEKEKYQSKSMQLEKELDWLKEQLKLIKANHFGKKSEKSSQIQVELFDEVAIDEVTDENEETEEITYTRKKPQPRNRYLDTTNLPREEKIHDLEASEKTCGCGHSLEKMGEDTREEIIYQPASLKVIDHVRLKYTCRHCETIKMPKAIELPIQKSKAGASLLAEIIMNKYAFHLPLYRQSKMLKIHGLEVGDATLGYWVMRASEALEPLGDAFWKELAKQKALQADETPVKLLKPEKKAYMWVYHSYLPQQRFIIFDFQLGRAQAAANIRLKDFSGILQTDGYAGYNLQRKRMDIVSVGCWDHARRYFTNVVKAAGNNKSGKAGGMLKLIAKLYELESEIKDKTFEERQRLRQEKATPILQHIQEYLQKIKAPPSSLLGKAVTYCSNQWNDLVRYVDHGEAELANCWIENQIRPFAVGKRNWLFIGNEVSGQRAALLYSLIQSCFMNDIDPRRYLFYVLNQVHSMRKGEVDPGSLLPHRIDPSCLPTEKSDQIKA